MHKAKIHSILFFTILLANCSKKVTNTFIACDAINIQDFGAVPNDGKDDSKAIQAAIDFTIQEGKSFALLLINHIYLH